MREAKLSQLAQHESIGLIEKNMAAKVARETLNQFAAKLRGTKVKLRAPVFDAESAQRLTELIKFKNVNPHTYFKSFGTIEDLLKDLYLD